LTHRATHRRRAAWIAATTLGLILLTVAPASAAAPTLTASLSAKGIINGSANAGAQTPFSLSVSSNQGSLQTLTLAAPPGFFVDLSTVVLSAGSLSGTSTSSKIVVGGLKISGSAVLTVSFDAYPACTPSAVQPYTWNLTAAQKGGTAYTPLNFSTAVTQPSSCELVFDLIHDQIKDQVFTPAVTVTVVRENASPDTTYPTAVSPSNAVSLSIETDPGSPGAILDGGGPVTPINGVATFSAVKLDQSGTGYVLEACSPTVNGEPCLALTGDSGAFLSNAFAVYDAESECHNNQTCSVSAPGLEVSTQVSVQGQIHQFVKAGIWDVPPAPPGSEGDPANLDCAGYDELTHTVASFDYTTVTGVKIIVNTISADVMKTIADQGVSHVQACFGSSIPFTDRFGDPAVPDATLGLFVGLLPDCPPGSNPLDFAPCIFSRVGGGGGTGQISYTAAALDPGGARH
jgi:hypothetical protein